MTLGYASDDTENERRVSSEALDVVLSIDIDQRGYYLRLACSVSVSSF
jgi:hypothetical protein